MQRTVVGVVPEMTVRELIHVLLENAISGVPVLDHEGKAIGVVSMTDVLQLAAAATFDQVQVRDIMTPVAFALEPTDTLEAATRFLVRGRVHRALVTEDGVLQGIITPLDLLRALDWS